MICTIRSLQKLLWWRHSKYYWFNGCLGSFYLFKCYGKTIETVINLKVSVKILLNCCILQYFQNLEKVLSKWEDCSSWGTVSRFLWKPDHILYTRDQAFSEQEDVTVCGVAKSKRYEKSKRCEVVVNWRKCITWISRE